MYPDKLNFIAKIGLPVLLGVFFSAQLSAQDFVTDTLHLNVYFRRDVSRVEPDYRDNGKNLQNFRTNLERWLQDSTAVVRTVVVRTAASPEGSTTHNRDLAEWRAHSIDRWLTDSLCLDSGLFRFQPVGEDWEGLAGIISALDLPWRDAALNIIKNTSIWEKEGGKIVDSRKNRLKRLRGGSVWKWLDEHVFPDLRAGSGSISCVVWHKAAPAAPDTVYIAPAPADTVYVDVPRDVFVTAAPEPKRFDASGRKMILALRTNFLAVPFTNVGVEIPLEEHWSIGADWYSPWIWRKNHKFPSLKHSSDIDSRGWAFQLQAADVEMRYWFTNKKIQPEQRLLGHSIGIYAAAGHYDFERNWHGHQGEFWNVGVDYLFARPVFRGRMHLELELSLGYILSRNQAYECVIKGGECYRTGEGRKIMNWLGPTRAQISLVYPIYVKKK